MAPSGSSTAFHNARSRLWTLSPFRPASSSTPTIPQPRLPPDPGRGEHLMTLTNSKAFSGFAVNDLEKAQEFYGETLGLNTSVQEGLLTLHLAGDRDTLIYFKPDYTPATYTILNFPVEDIGKAVDDLTARGVKFERYDGIDH